MPVCCRCNGSGRCKSCSCVKSGRPCVDCLPSRKGHCCNNALPPTTPAADDRRCALRSPTVNTLGADNVLDSQDVPGLRSFAVSANAGAIFDDVITGPATTPEVRTLPSFRTSSWGDLSGEESTKVIDDAYAQIIYWRPNLFKVPSGACGKHFVAEFTRLFNSFAMESDLEAVALKAAMTLPSLMLQKPHAKSKTHDHISCLQRRLSLWEKGDISNLLKEGRALQRSLATSQRPNPVNPHAYGDFLIWKVLITASRARKLEYAYPEVNHLFFQRLPKSSYSELL